MASVVEYPTPPQARDTRTFRELFTHYHQEIVALGVRGPVISLGVCLSSTCVLVGQGCSWLYRKIRGYT